MLIKVLSLVFDSARGNFDDSPLREFLKDKEIISVENHFFTKNETPYLTLIIKYFPVRAELDAELAPLGKRDESWREMLSESDMGVFDRLREWRSKRCREDGVPPYILFTNKQLAQLIKVRPVSLTDFEKIEGVGTGKRDKYGKDILEILSHSKGESNGLSV